MKYIVGVDIALRKSGIAIINSEKELISSDILTIKPKFTQWEAVDMIYHYFKNLKLPDDTSEVVWAIEDVLAMVHVKAALSIHSARTAATLGILHSNTSNRSIIYYTPNEVKHWLTRKRGAKKPEVKAAFEEKFPQYIQYNLKEDEIDATLLALYHSTKEKK